MEHQISHSSTPDSSPKPSDKFTKPADKENQPPSSARASLGSKKKVPTLNDVELRRKRVKPDSDSEDTYPPHNTKRIKLAHRSDPSASVLDYMKSETTRREAVEAQMLSEMKKGNEQFAESLKNTQTFQTDF